MSLKNIQKLPDKWILDLVFEYDESTGILKWKEISREDAYRLHWSSKRYLQFNTRYAGQEAGHEFTTTKGAKSIQVRFDSKSYYLHRIIWKIVYDTECNLIDHIDGNPLNNRICNLRSVDSLTNSKNCKLSVTNKSGHTGVSWSKSNNKWEAYIWKDYKKYNLGLYEDLDDAVAARKAKSIEFGYHENHGTVRDGTQ